MHGYLIAFSGKPQPKFLESVRALSAQDGVPILSAILTEGPGCYNLAFLIDGPNERFATAITMALMPAKYETCVDPRLKAGEFIDEVHPAT